MAEDEEVVECPHCGYMTSKKAIRCPRCGNSLEEEIEKEKTEEEEEKEEEDTKETEEEGEEEEIVEVEEPKKRKTIAKEKAVERLTQISEVDEKMAEALFEHGLESPKDIAEEGMTGLAGIHQVGFESAKKILGEAKEIYEDEVEEKEREVVETITRDIEELERMVFEEGKEEGLEEKIEGLEKEEEAEPPETIRRKRETKKNFYGLFSFFTSFLIPAFFVILVGIELGVVLMAYPYAYPAQTLYYLTPYPFLDPSWISSLTVSFLIVLGLFLTTWRGLDFSFKSEVKTDKNILSISLIMSVVMSFSLTLHLYNTQSYSGIFLGYTLLVMLLILIPVQISILKGENLVLIQAEEKKVCSNCGEELPLEQNTCPKCDLDIKIPKERASKNP